MDMIETVERMIEAHLKMNDKLPSHIVLGRGNYLRFCRELRQTKKRTCGCGSYAVTKFLGIPIVVVKGIDILCKTAATGWDAMEGLTTEDMRCNAGGAK